MKKQKNNKNTHSHKDNYKWIDEGIPALREELDIVLSSDSIAVPHKRYDELIKKEGLLESIEKAYRSAPSYNFREAVGYILGKEAEE